MTLRIGKIVSGIEKYVSDIEKYVSDIEKYVSDIEKYVSDIEKYGMKTVVENMNNQIDSRTISNERELLYLNPPTNISPNRKF